MRRCNVSATAKAQFSGCPLPRRQVPGRGLSRHDGARQGAPACGGRRAEPVAQRLPGHNVLQGSKNAGRYAVGAQAARGRGRENRPASVAAHARLRARPTSTGLYPCAGGKSENQQFFFTKAYNEIRREGTFGSRCLDFAGGAPMTEAAMYGCHLMKGNQEWEHTPSKRIKHRPTKLCLEALPTTANKVRLRPVRLLSAAMACPHPSFRLAPDCFCPAAQGSDEHV